MKKSIPAQISFITKLKTGENKKFTKTNRQKATGNTPACRGVHQADGEW
jgi:hypothetical protein